MKFLLITLIAFLSACTESDINWNDSNLTWYDYDSGIELATHKKLPALLILYADWCSTCKSYSELFHLYQVEKELHDLVLIRVDVDDQPELSEAYNFDGKYVPRTFGITRQGHLASDLGSDTSRYAHFIPADEPLKLIDVVHSIKAH